MTGAELAQAALELIGAYSPADGAVPAADQETALRHANFMRKSWNAQNLALHAMERQTFTWPAATTSRTIGPTGQLIGTRPLAVLYAKMRVTSNAYEMPVTVVTEEEYAAIADKTQTAEYARALRYEPTGAGVGTLTLWPIPTGTPTLILHNKALLGTIVADTEFEIPEAYEAALVSQLAKRLAVIFGKPWTQAQEDIAVMDFATVKSANVHVPAETPMPAGFPGTRITAMSRSRFHDGTI